MNGFEGLSKSWTTWTKRNIRNESSWIFEDDDPLI